MPLLNIEKHPDHEDILVVSTSQTGRNGQYTFTEHTSCSRESVMGQLANEVLALREQLNIEKAINIRMDAKQQSKGLTIAQVHYDAGVNAFKTGKPCPYSPETFAYQMHLWGYLHADNIECRGKQGEQIADLKQQVAALTVQLDTEKSKPNRVISALVEYNDAVVRRLARGHYLSRDAVDTVAAVLNTELEKICKPSVMLVKPRVRILTKPYWVRVKKNTNCLREGDYGRVLTHPHNGLYYIQTTSGADAWVFKNEFDPAPLYGAAFNISESFMGGSHGRI